MSKTRLFSIAWNCSKIPNLATSERMETRRAEGTHYANGCVGLDTEASYASMSDMEEHFRSYGAMRYVYQDKSNGADLTLDDVSHEPSRIPARRKFRLAGALREISRR